jgi:hypothetical protein
MNETKEDRVTCELILMCQLRVTVRLESMNFCHSWACSHMCRHNVQLKKVRIFCYMEEYNSANEVVGLAKRQRHGVKISDR